MQEFHWDQANIDHIARHNLSPVRVEQVIGNNPFEIGRYFRNGEERLNQVGETDAGLVLVVVTTFRGESSVLSRLIQQTVPKDLNTRS